MQNPQDRDWKRWHGPIEKLGGKMHTSFFALVLSTYSITEFPDILAAAAIAIAFATGGAVSNIQTAPLLTAAQAVEARCAKPVHAATNPLHPKRLRARQRATNAVWPTFHGRATPMHYACTLPR